MIFDRYAEYYDIFYEQKNYVREVDYLERIFRKHFYKKPKTILDLGCGTGNHMIHLAKRGYKVAGIDQSRRMLNFAKNKLGILNLKVELKKQNLETFRLDQKFDVIICLFSVINYIPTAKSLLKVLRKIFKHLKKESILVFDFWNADAVERLYSPLKKKRFVGDEEVIERRSKTVIDKKRRLCRVFYSILMKKNGRVVGKEEETHVLKYYTIDEMAQLLKKARLKVLDIHPFLKMNTKVRRNNWNITVVAQKI